MRSLVLKSTLAAILLSSSLGIASAAQGMGTAGPPMRHMMPKHHAMMMHRAHSRLAMINTELGRIGHRIRIDSRHGRLNAMERRTVMRDWRDIRRQAHTVAARHHGRIPNAQFAQLQHEVHGLNRLVHRYSTNSRMG